MYFYLLLTIVICMMIYFLFKAYNNTRSVVVNVIDQTHKSDDPTINILQLSDLHLENISISPEQLYEKLKGEEIDLITLTGDFLDRKRSIPKLIPYLTVFEKLNPIYGTYAVLGNHDYFLRDKYVVKLIQTLEEHSCKVLRNDSETINIRGRVLNIIGVDDFSSKKSDLDSSYKKVKNGMNLVITHDPNIVLEMKQYSFDYLLAGHFHGGQICYPKPYHLVKMGKLVRMDMIKGLHNYQGKSFYINEGLGQTGVNIRVGSRPEITIHRLSIAKVEEKVIS